MRKGAAILAVALLAAAGCFNEPEPAYKSVPAENRVYLSDKGLVDLAGEAEALKAGAAIDYVNLDRNRLETFPAELAALTGLKWLRLNDNRLSELPDLGALVNLRRIYLRGNRFAAVPETLKAEIPDWLAAKKGLQALSFTRTQVTQLPADLTAWRSLKQLQLGDLKLSADERARIRAALPGTAIVF